MLARLVCAIGIAVPAVGFGFADHLFVVTSNGTTAGSSAAVQLQSPWIVTPGVEPVGAHPFVRHFTGLHDVVNGTPADDLRVLDPTSFEPVLWDGRDADGAPVAAGVYFLHATGDARAQASTTIHVLR